MGVSESKNTKFKETIIGMGRFYDENIIKRKKTSTRKRNSLISSKNIKDFRRRSLILSNFHNSSKRNIMSLMKNEDESNAKEIMAILALKKINKQLKNNIGNNIKDKLYKYENNDIIDAINKLPNIEENNQNNVNSSNNNQITGEKNKLNINNNNNVIENKEDLEKKMGKIILLILKTNLEYLH